MRILNACMGCLVILVVTEAASAQSAFTISHPNATRSADTMPDVDETMKQYRRRSSRQEMIYRRAARAAAKREARIQSRHNHGFSAARPAMVFDRPQVEWIEPWWWTSPRVTATYYRRVR